MESGIQSLNPRTAAELVNSGEWVLVDVRPVQKWEEAHPEGAISVPTFQKVGHCVIKLHMMAKLFQLIQRRGFSCAG